MPYFRFRKNKQAKNLSSEESANNVEDKGIKLTGEGITNQDKVFHFSFASFRDISQGYVQHGVEGGDTKA